MKENELDKKWVRNAYKQLQKVEKAFREMKTDRLELRPVFHIQEETTRSHILIWMFAYSVIHQMEEKIYPWLREMKEINKKEKLSFNDIIEELKMIKLNILSFWKDIPIERRLTTLTERQKQILEALWISEEFILGF